ncbi:MAG: hypothetical protein J5654_07180 [Victivallales bacterium]|nr:hypothetical protein [Victivallales bacterium]
MNGLPQKVGIWENYIFPLEKSYLLQRKSLKLRIVINLYISIGEIIKTAMAWGQTQGASRFPWGQTPKYGDRQQVGINLEIDTENINLSQHPISLNRTKLR